MSVRVKMDIVLVLWVIILCGSSFNLRWSYGTRTSRAVSQHCRCVQFFVVRTVHCAGGLLTTCEFLFRGRDLLCGVVVDGEHNETLLVFSDIHQRSCYIFLSSSVHYIIPHHLMNKKTDMNYCVLRDF